MKKSIRYMLYLFLGFILYQVIDSGKTDLTHKEVKNVLAIALIIVFVLLVIIGIIKNRYENGDKK